MKSLTSTVIAVIPARGGSKGIPNKNVVDLAGKPLLAWSIDSARSAGTKIRVLVTTDSQSIAKVAAEHGAEVVMRPRELSLDESPTESAIIHALQTVRAYGDEIVVLLQPTSPVRHSKSIDRALQAFEYSGCDSLVGVVPASPFIWHGPIIDGQARYDVGNRPRRQDIQEENRIYRENGSIYIFRASGIREHLNRIHGRIRLFVMEQWESIDVDTEYDLLLIRAVLADMERQGVENDTDPRNKSISHS